MSQENEKEVDKTTTEQQNGNLGLSFGITTETKSSNFTPLKVATKLDTPDPRFPYGWSFPIARLVNVVANPEYETKNGKKAVIQFIFKDRNGSQYTHIEWEQDPTDVKIKEKMDGLNVRIKHIYTTVFGNFPEQGIGANAKSFADFFDKVAKAFNEAVNEAGSKIYATKDLYYKVTYYNGNVGFPLSPNFLEEVKKDKPCNLNINLKYDKIDSTATASTNPMFNIGGEDMPFDTPDFESDYN